MKRQIRWFLAAAVSVGLVSACDSPTMPRYPNEEDRDREEPGPRPGNNAWNVDVNAERGPFLA